MALRIPQRNLAEWASGIVEECFASREQRRDLVKMYRSYYYTGTSDAEVTTYNRIYPHIDRLSAFLFSPADVRFTFEFDSEETQEVHGMGDAAARKFNREFRNRNLDMAFKLALDGALIDGCQLIKGIWGHDGMEGWIVRPGFFGVLREDIDDLDRQEAFVQSTYMTPGAFERTIWDHPDREKIMARVKEGTMTNREQDEFNDDYFHQIIVGGTQPVSLTTSSGSGMVGIVGVPTPVLDTKVVTSLIRMDELWVQDLERQDYTTIRVVKPDIVIEGLERRRNLCGLTDGVQRDSDLKGHHPFTKVCANETEGYFWGQSEIAYLYRLQDDLNEQIQGIRRLTKLRSDPPRSATGFAGLTLEKYKAFKRPGGFIAEENPNAKMQEHTPELPPELFKRLDTTMSMFDDVAGFTPILAGQGEQGVRSQQQAATLARNSSPRMRDRALAVERQCVEWGDFCFRMLQAKDATVNKSGKNEFLLSQLPEDAKLIVDSHSSSPVYSEDHERLAFALAKLGAIDGADTIMLTHPPHMDILIAHAKQREIAQAQFAKEHPELLMKGKRK